MKIHPMVKSTCALAVMGALGSAVLAFPAAAQTLPISSAQRATANDVAQKGVPLSALADNAPDRYTVKTGDTLWAISTLYLKSPWRWPELWGMNLQEINNPHRIYPGQVLQLERGLDGARLRVVNDSGGAGGTAGGNMTTSDVAHISPRIRSTSLLAAPLPTIDAGAIEAFLAEPLIVDAAAFEQAPRIVSGREGRQVLTSGDRAYAIGPNNAPLLDDQPAEKRFRVYGAAKPLRHPDTQAILGYEASFEGTATLIKGETRSGSTDSDGKVKDLVAIAAAIDLTSTTTEVNMGDRLLPALPFQLQTYVPHAPASQTESRVVSIYGTAVTNAAQNQVVAISGGSADGVDVGTVFAIQKNGVRVTNSKVQQSGIEIRLPAERIGLLLVFRTFEHLSYGLILEISAGVSVGDRLVSPR